MSKHHGLSPLLIYHCEINVDTQPPAQAQISSSTDPDPAKTYHHSTMSFGWNTSDVGSGIAGYSYRLDKDPKGQPRQEVRTNGTSITLSGLDTGVWRSEEHTSELQ